jgi:enterochelin esterase family protein
MNDLLTQAKNAGTPLIHDNQVTFLWQGENPPVLMGDFQQWHKATAITLTETAPNLWTHTLDLPCDAYMEYGFILDPNSEDGSDANRAPDPFNSRTKWNGIKATNHYFYMPEATPTPLVTRKRGIAKGKMTHHRVKTRGLVAGISRDLWLYQPPTDQPVSLLLVLDGRDYIQQAKLAAIVDNLIAQGQIPPIAMALVQNGKTARTNEYGCNDVTYRFFQHCVFPLAQQKLNLIDIQQNPGAWGVMGASMGGVMSLYLGLRFPETFGKVLSQAGAFAINGHDFIVYDLIRWQGVPQNLNIWLDWGTYDFLQETNERMLELLNTHTTQLAHCTYTAGHNYYAWRDHVALGLTHLFRDKCN